MAIQWHSNIALLLYEISGESLVEEDVLLVGNIVDVDLVSDWHKGSLHFHKLVYHGLHHAVHESVKYYFGQFVLQELFEVVHDNVQWLQDLGFAFELRVEVLDVNGIINDVRNHHSLFHCGVEKDFDVEVTKWK